jgi:uncharacterized damage-inducible protein DinB
MSTAGPTRTDPPLVAAERETLIGYLEYHRATLAAKCEGLTTAQLRRRSVPPSNLSLLGLIRHLAEVELGWFSRFQGRAVAGYWCTEEHLDADFDDVDTADPDEAFATWRRTCEASDRVLAGASFDDTFVTEARGPISLRWLVAHLVEEYARHNGHADLLREAIDGVTGE